MKKRIKDIFVGLIIGILITSTPVFANSILANIDVVLNGVNVQLEGEDVQVNSILYNGTTYLPMRKVIELVEKDIEWNQQTMTVNIIKKTDNLIENNKDGDNKMDLTNDVSYEDFIKMFDLRFTAVDEEKIKSKHFIYNGSLSYEDLKEKILNYSEEQLIEFSELAMKDAFGKNNLNENVSLYLCFNYSYEESMFGKDTLFQSARNKNEESIGKTEVFLYK